MEIPFGLMPEGVFCVRMEMVGIITEKTGVLPNREEMVRITRQA